MKKYVLAVIFLFALATVARADFDGKPVKPPTDGAKQSDPRKPPGLNPPKKHEHKAKKE